MTPFVWGQGGQRLTPEQIMARQQMANQKMQSDYSPVNSVWEGLGRVVDNVSGALDTRSLNRAEQANTAESNALLQSLMGGNQDAVTQALTSPYASQQVRDFAQMQWELAHPKASAPHYWETNDGSLGMVGPDGKPQILYQDPTPKITTIAVDNADGTKTLVRVGPDGVPIGMGVGGKTSGAMPGASPVGLPTAPVGKLTPLPGGPTQPASGGFRP